MLKLNVVLKSTNNPSHLQGIALNVIGMLKLYERRVLWCSNYSKICSEIYEKNNYTHILCFL